ncbi:hypothetical protein MSAN_00121000 [Mycena sanguinolenta]|uniref:Uncharacterized protein n=1 Tax=Mycena sanguinolenta TaxID=230812 RepID=A0A8H6ZGR1_9AGAR|nr:hypothetical protein MSAN_00121000 [Mycena sanguinolenta]
MRVAYVAFSHPVHDLTYPKNQDFAEVFNYLYSASRRYFFASNCTNWIRRSTGRLCAELTPANDYLWLDVLSPKSSVLSGEYSLNAGADITKFIDSLTLEQYHFICVYNLGQNGCFDLSASTTVNFGAVFHCSKHLLEDSDEIAFLPNAEAPYLDNWKTSEGSTGEVMPNDWTRFRSSDVFNNTLAICAYIPSGLERNVWLSQANHIFRRLNIMSNFEDYGTDSAHCFCLG